VPVIVKECPEPDKGLGVFATATIDKGTLMWKPSTITKMSPQQAQELLDSMPAEEARVFLRHCFVVPNDTEHLCCNPRDNGRFTNHHHQPNAGACVDACADSFALRTIHEGEEVTCDYRLYANPEWYLDLCKQFGCMSTAEVARRFS
jgi:SET domain-containing protein